MNLDIHNTVNISTVLDTIASDILAINALKARKFFIKKNQYISSDFDKIDRKSINQQILGIFDMVPLFSSMQKFLQTFDNGIIHTKHVVKQPKHLVKVDSSILWIKEFVNCSEGDCAIDKLIACLPINLIQKLYGLPGNNDNLISLNHQKLSHNISNNIAKINAVQIIEQLSLRDDEASGNISYNMSNNTAEVVKKVEIKDHHFSQNKAMPRFASNIVHKDVTNTDLVVDYNKKVNATTSELPRGNDEDGSSLYEYLYNFSSDIFNNVTKYYEGVNNDYKAIPIKAVIFHAAYDEYTAHKLLGRFVVHIVTDISVLNITGPALDILFSDKNNCGNENFACLIPAENHSKFIAPLYYVVPIMLTGGYLGDSLKEFIYVGLAEYGYNEFAPTTMLKHVDKGDEVRIRLNSDEITANAIDCRFVVKSVAQNTLIGIVATAVRYGTGVGIGPSMIDINTKVITHHIYSAAASAFAIAFGAYIISSGMYYVSTWHLGNHPYFNIKLSGKHIVDACKEDDKCADYTKEDLYATMDEKCNDGDELLFSIKYLTAPTISDIRYKNEFLKHTDHVQICIDKSSSILMKFVNVGVSALSVAIVTYGAYQMLHKYFGGGAAGASGGGNGGNGGGGGNGGNGGGDDNDAGSRGDEEFVDNRLDLERVHDDDKVYHAPLLNTGEQINDITQVGWIMSQLAGIANLSSFGAIMHVNNVSPYLEAVDYMPCDI